MWAIVVEELGGDKKYLRGKETVGCGMLRYGIVVGTTENC